MPRFQSQILVLLGLLQSSSVWAQESTSVEVRDPPGWQGSLGVGLAQLYPEDPDSLAPSARSQGLAITGSLRRRIGPKTQWQLSLGTAWTEGDRLRSRWETGLNLGRWTTQAYRDVYAWSIKEDSPSIFRVPASMVAYGLLGLAYSASAGIMMTSPIAAHSFDQIDTTLSHHFIQPDRGPYLEAGLALHYHWLTEDSSQQQGLGTVTGLGFRQGPVHIQSRLTWTLSGDDSVSSPLHITAFTFTLGLGS